MGQIQKGATATAKAMGSVGQVAFDQIRGDILSGRLTPGKKLKLENLRDEYNVSVNTLRETLTRLSSDGFVLAEGQKGFRVVPVSLADLNEIIELRRLLECHGFRRSMEIGDLDWESAIVRAHHKLISAERLMLKDEAAHRADWERYDKEFHAALISACGSRRLITAHASIHYQYFRYQQLALKMRPFRGEQSLGEHKAILEKALIRDAENATRLLSDHIDLGSKVPVSVMTDRGS